MLTIRELLADVGLQALAGEASLDAPLRWVHISELRDPTPWLSGGELLLTTGMQLDTPRQQRAFVARLADHQLAGLGVGTGFAHKTIPKSMLAAATERDFPLFEVPYEVPFIAITEKAFARLVNDQYAVLQRSIAAHERLERVVLSERGLEAVVAALATLVGGAVFVFDARGEPLVQRTFRRALDEQTIVALRHELRARARNGDQRGFLPSAPDLSGRALALPVAATGDSRPGAATPQAWLVAAKDSGGLSEFDRLTLHQAVTIVALELLRRRVAEDTERRLAGDVLSAIVSDELKGGELERRLEPFGLGGDVAVLVLGLGAAELEVGEAALVAALREEAVNGLVATNGALACALVPAAPEEELFALAERVRARAGAEIGRSVPAGAGRGGPAADVRRTYHEARCALEACALARGDENGHDGDRVATYKDLGSFQLLLSLQDEDALRLYCDSLLGPIENGDSAYGGELMRSLEAFIEENGQWERAARRLYCHRHTLRYRIRRVEELTGRNLGSARDRIEFWLALRGRELTP